MHPMTDSPVQVLVLKAAMNMHAQKKTRDTLTIMHPMTDSPAQVLVLKVATNMLKKKTRVIREIFIQDGTPNLYYLIEKD